MLSNENLRSSTVAIEGGLCASSHVATPIIMVPCPPSWCPGQLLVRSFCYKTHFPSFMYCLRFEGNPDQMEKLGLGSKGLRD